MARDELDQRLEELKQQTDAPERRRQEASDLDAAVAEDFRQERSAGAVRSAADPEAAEAAFLEGRPGAVGDVDDEASDAEGEAPWSGREPHLLSFYDRLRDRVTDAVEQRGGRLGPSVVRALLLVPDVFILMVRLTLDREVPASARAMIGGALAYFILPVDLLPEAVIGAGGYLDDLVLASAVLAQTFSGDLEPYARKHWSGREELRTVLRDVSDAAQGLLGRNLYDKVQRLLNRRGIRVEDTRS